MIFSRWQPKSRSQDKCVFAFYAEIQHGCQKWRESDFCEKPPVDSAHNLQIRNFVEITLSRTVCQINVFCILRRNSIWSPKNGGKVIFAKCRLRVQNFVEIALSHTVSEMNALLRFMQKFKIAAKSGGKAIFAKKSTVDSAYILWDKRFRRNRSITHHFQDKCF